MEEKQKLLDKLEWHKRFTTLDSVVNIDLSNDSYIGSVIIGKLWEIARFSKKLIITCSSSTAKVLKITGSDYVKNINNINNVELIEAD